MGISLFRRAPSNDSSADDSALGLNADDLRRLIELERGQRALLQSAYAETVAALARVLESKDSGTGAHSQRVQRYALELADEVAPELLDDRSMEYGFLLHDVGKIGIPDSVLRKPAPLDDSERQLMETHTVLGERMLEDLALLRGEGLRVVRSHHERWDGGGYPDGRAGTEIPHSARILAVADDRPYRRAGSWQAAAEEIDLGASFQFDPEIVEAFHAREFALRRLSQEIDSVEPALIAQ